MDYFEISWGIISILIFVGVIFYNYKVFRNFDKNEQLSMTKVFLSDRGPKAFTVFATGFVIFGIFMLVGALTVNYDDIIYHYASKIGSGIMFATWLYFMYTIAEISSN